MVEPLIAAALGGLAIDEAQAEIAKWVGAQIKVRVELALRNKVLEQGLPAKDQQAELSAVLTSAVALTARELFPGQERLQKNFSKTLLKGKPEQRPLVNGSDLVYITDDIHEWITGHDPQPGARSIEADRSSHPYLAILCRNIIAQYGFRAENNGAKNTILTPSWNRFWTTELFINAAAEAAAVYAHINLTRCFNDHKAFNFRIVVEVGQHPFRHRPTPGRLDPCMGGGRQRGVPDDG